MEKADKYGAADLIMGILLVLSGIYVIHESLQMKVYKTFLDAPGFFPLILGIIFIVLGTLMSVSAYVRKGHRDITKVFAAERIKSILKTIEFKRAMVLTLLMIIYIFVLIGRVHFTIASAVYLALTFHFLKSTTLLRNLVLSVTVSLAISFVFTNFFHIPLP